MTNDTCGHTSDYFDRMHIFVFVVYNLATPIFAILALFGQTLLLHVLIKRWKSEGMYAYQVYCASAEAAAVVIKILFFLSIQTDPGIMGDHRTPFRESLSRCYACVWYSARLARPLAAAICTLCLLLSTVMAADRVLGLLRPMLYKNMNHRVWQRASLAVCVILSFSASTFDVRKTYVATAGDEGTYAMTIDSAYVRQKFVQILALFRVLLQTLGLICLASLSVALCYLYRTRFLNPKLKLGGKAEQQEAKRNENILITFTLFQCLHSVLYMSMGLGITAFGYCFPGLHICWRGPLATGIDLARMILDVANFYGVLFVSKKVRRVVKSEFHCLQKEDSETNVVEMQMTETSL